MPIWPPETEADWIILYMYMCVSAATCFFSNGVMTGGNNVSRFIDR